MPCKRARGYNVGPSVNDDDPRTLRNALHSRAMLRSCALGGLLLVVTTALGCSSSGDAEGNSGSGGSGLATGGDGASGSGNSGTSGAGGRSEGGASSGGSDTGGTASGTGGAV